MKLTNIKNIGVAILGLVMLFGISMVSASTAQAQYPNQDQYRRQRERERQAEIQRQLEIQRQAELQRNRGNGRWDDRNRPGRRGRNGDGYGNLGGSYELRQTALNAGYNEGMKEGRKDRNSRDRFDFRDEGAYRNANKDYNSRMGDRGAYAQYFRAAFENGYSDGYYGY